MGSVLTRQVKVRVLSLRSVKSELWAPICRALGVQAEVATTAASRGVCYGDEVGWASELDGSEQAGDDRWTNVICLAHAADEELASTMEYFEKWVAAGPARKKHEDRRATLVLLRRPRRMDAREHGVAQAKWAEFVNIEGGHSLTRQVGIHTGEQRMPADDVSGITVLVCSTEGANERWPIGRSSVEPLVSALDEMGITSGEAVIKVPTEDGWSKWWKAPVEKDAPAHKAFSDINPFFNDEQMANMQRKEETSEEADAAGGSGRPKPRFGDILRARLARKAAARPEAPVDAASEALWVWQEEQRHGARPCENNRRIPSRLRCAGFFARDYLEGYPITGRNERQTMKALSRAVLTFVRKVRRKRTKLRHLMDRCGEGRTERKKCAKCSKSHEGASAKCPACRRSDEAKARRSKAKRALLMDRTSLRAEILAGRPLTAQRMGIDVLGMSGAPAWKSNSTRSASASMHIATVVNGGVQCRDKLRVSTRSGIHVVAGRLRLTTSVSEYRDMIDKPYNSVRNGAMRGCMRIGVYGAGDSDVAAAQDTSLRAGTTRGRCGNDKKHEGLKTIRSEHPACLRRLARAHKLSSPGAGAYQNAMPKAKAKCDKQRLAKLRELTTWIRGSATAGISHWMMLAEAELRSVCIRRGLSTTGGRKALAERVARKLGYNDYQVELKGCSEAASEYGREGVHLPPMEVVEMVRGWSGRDVQLSAQETASRAFPPEHGRAPVRRPAVRKRKNEWKIWYEESSAARAPALPFELGRRDIDLGLSEASAAPAAVEHQKKKKEKKRGRKQAKPKSLSRWATVQEETWRITPSLVMEATRLRVDTCERARLKSARAKRSGEEEEHRGTRLRELVYDRWTKRQIWLNDRWITIRASRDGEEIVVVGNAEGLKRIRPEQVFAALTRREPAWLPAMHMLKQDGYKQGGKRQTRDNNGAREIMPLTIEALLRGNERNTYEYGPEARRGDVCVFPPDYFGPGVRAACGILLTNRTVGTREGNEKKREFVDVALQDELAVYELSIDDPEWNKVIRAGSLRKNTEPRRQ